MYSPKISEEYIPYLYKQAKSENRPMTQLVNSIIKKHVTKQAKKINLTNCKMCAIIRHVSQKKRKGGEQNEGIG